MIWLVLFPIVSRVVCYWFRWSVCLRLPFLVRDFLCLICEVRFSLSVFHNESWVCLFCCLISNLIWIDKSWVALSFDLTRAGRALSFDLARAGSTLSLLDYSSSLSSNSCFIVDVWWFGWCFFLLFPGLFVVDFVGVFVCVFLFLFGTSSFSFVACILFLFSMLNPESVCFVA